MQEEVMVAMPDGIRLRTKIAGAGVEPRPVVLVRDYNTDFWDGIADRFVAAGYVYVGQARPPAATSARKAPRAWTVGSSTTARTATMRSRGSVTSPGATAMWRCEEGRRKVEDFGWW